MKSDGLIGVQPILFNKLEFLNSNINCGIDVNVTAIGEIESEPDNIWLYPKIFPKIAININGNINAKNGPKKPFQNDFCIKFHKGLWP